MTTMLAATSTSCGCRTTGLLFEPCKPHRIQLRHDEVLQSVNLACDATCYLCQPTDENARTITAAYLATKPSVCDRAPTEIYDAHLQLLEDNVGCLIEDCPFCTFRCGDHNMVNTQEDPNQCCW
jgi:hypothetical protein